MSIKFELEPYHRNTPSEVFLNDLRKVALKLNKESLSQTEYNQNGQYHSSTLGLRFGSWVKALEAAGLQVRKYQIIQKEELILDLQRVAKLLNKLKITRADYNSYGKYSSTAALSKFDSWFNALEASGLEKTRIYGVTKEEYFKNIEEIWIKLGRQPKYNEIVKPFSKFSGGAYERRFGTWRKALESFVEYINNYTEREEIEYETKIENDNFETPEDINENKIIKHKTKRNVSFTLRFIIMKRDNFKCKKCGRSPAFDPKVQLHVDHIYPWIKGGETEPNNLETLCLECNLGKSDSV